MLEVREGLQGNATRYDLCNTGTNQTELIGNKKGGIGIYDR
jgi:hypothetical protein